ncbi:hypothetical protein [Avibacterium sp. 21-599]|uniref:hypothetical protein n=1 Tax=Avibacterium sp. 21-599 TaxID=2911528 RepID=UPI0022450612|nr:hypothetical protein [Avibacterium sp. 21-599]MCW9717533.1 hypothetical protein [Avibacterium sp. 21-599]
MIEPITQRVKPQNGQNSNENVRISHRTFLIPFSISSVFFSYSSIASHRYLYQRQADITLRITLPEQSSLVTRRLCTSGYHWYRHRDYLANTPKVAWTISVHHLRCFKKAWDNA